MDRISTPAGRLARRGFGDPTAAAVVLDRWADALGDESLLAAVVDEVLAAADPDLALSGVDRLAASDSDLFRDVAADRTWLHRVTRVVGASVALNHHLGVRPGDARALAGDIAARTPPVLRAELLQAVGADATSDAPVADPGRSDDLRRAYRVALLRIAARDLTAEIPEAVVGEVAAELADLADAAVETALALARGETPGWEGCRLAVLAMGKAGARELNYCSDVDVIYVAEPEAALGVANRLAGAVARICSAHTAAGTIWPVDANLRPEGKNGPLVRTLASMGAYYGKWAKNWEFQALIKARPMAGDLALANEFVDLVAERVWTVADDPGFVSETQAMRQRVISLIPAREADLELKLGAGGLRDTEFSVQLLQLVHGRADERLRLRGTFEALEELVAHGYVGRAEGAQLEAAYRTQRVLEHRAQLFRLRRTHLLPTSDLDLRRTARSMGLASPEAVTDAWKTSRRRVLRLHRRIFYSPLLEAVARVPSGAVRLTSEAAETRLAALGFADPRAALRHIEALSTGFTRQAEIQRQLLPAMLGWFAAGPNPDHGLLAFRQVSDALGSTSWYLRALRDEGAMAENLARVLASSRYAVDLMLRAPQAVQLLADVDAVRPRPMADIAREMTVSAGRHTEPKAAVEAIRAVRREELLRLAVGDLLGEVDSEAVGAALSDVTSATIDATLRVVTRDVPDCPRIALVAMGRWGGRELSFGSDADAIALVEDSDDPGVTKRAMAVLTEVRKLLAAPGPDPALEIDLDLRPEGRGGPMLRSLASTIAYYRTWSSTWEAQALLRADWGAGDRDLVGDLLDSVAPLRYPADGLTTKQVTEIRKLKARMEAERLPRAGDPRRNVKLGAGGLTDVEWCAQLMQLQHAAAMPALRTTMTLPAIDAAQQAGHLAEADADALREAWLFATRLRNAVMLLRGKTSDSIPADVRDVAAVAELLGYAKGEASMLLDDWSRRARQARQVMDRVFWGAG